MLAPVHAELLEAVLDARGERRGGPGGIGEHEHAHRARLAVADDLELERIGRGGLPHEQPDDRLEDAARLRSEKRERDVMRPDRPPGNQMPGGPTRELRGDDVWELEGEEEPEAVIPLDASRRAHPDV